MGILDHFSNWVRDIFGYAKCALAWTLAVFAITFLAFLSLQDVIEAARKCQTLNVFGICVENKLRSYETNLDFTPDISH